MIIYGDADLDFGINIHKYGEDRDAHGGWW